MKKRVIEIGSDLLLSFQNHCVIMAIAMMLVGVCGFDTPLLGLWFVLWSIPVYLYITRISVSNFFLFFFVQLLPLAAVCMIKMHILLKLIVLCMTLFYGISSIKIRFVDHSEELVFIPTASISILGATCIIEELIVKKGWGNYYLLLTFIYLIAYFFYYFFSQYLSFIYINKNSASNIPEREMFVSGMKQTGVYVACVVTVMLMTVNVEWLAILFRLIGKGVRAVLRFLFSLLQTNQSADTEFAEETQGVMEDMAGLLETGGPHPFWAFMEKVTLAAFFVGAIVLTVMGIMKGYQYLRKHFRGIERNQQQVQSGEDIRESCEIERDGEEHLRWFPFLNNAEKIRKMYRKSILKNKALIVEDAVSKELEYFTAKECCDKLSADTLKDIYEKARYSNESVTVNDVRNMKNSLKKDI